MAIGLNNRQFPTGMEWRFLLAVVLSVIAHLLLLLIFLNPQRRSGMEPAKSETSIEVALTTLPKARPATKPPAAAPAPMQPTPKPPKPVPKPKPITKPKPAPPVHNEPIEPPPVEEPIEPKPPKRQPKPAKAEPVPEFKDDFRELSSSYSQAATSSPQSVTSSGSNAKPDNGVHPGAILNINPRIYYPRNAIQKGMQGVVVVLIHISTDGHADGVDLIQSSGYEELDNQVLGAVQHWRFTPPRRGDTPVEGTYKHTVIFGENQEVINDFATHWRDIKLMPTR